IRSPAVSIASIDLNLMFVLHTVLAERNVARAAARLHVTPSAVSNALARLREVLGDPLVTRKGRGIVPTPRANELAPAIARAIQELEHALQAGPFDAASCTRTFTLAVADAGQITWVPRIATGMTRELPKAHLRVVGIDSLVSPGADTRRSASGSRAACSVICVTCASIWCLEETSAIASPSRTRKRASHAR